MKEPASHNPTSRVFVLAFQGAEIFYSTAEDRIYSALAPSRTESSRPTAEAAKPERKTAR